MKASERHHLKENELVTSLDRSAHWLSQNRPLLLKSAVAILALGVLAGGAYAYWSSQTRKAETALAKALRTFHASVGKDSAPPADAGADAPPHFDTAEARNTKAAEELEKVVKDFPRTAPGRQARFYLALSQTALGRLEDAERNLTEVTRTKGDLQYYVASQSLANVKHRRGDAQGAIEMYGVLINDPKNPLPKDGLLLQVGQWREAAGKLDEARRDYQKILDDYPSSAVRGEAESRRQLIDERASSPS